MEIESRVADSLATGLEEAMVRTRGQVRFFDLFKARGGLEPKWHSHFGNYIDKTLLALHKFQAKKQLSLWTVRINLRFHGGGNFDIIFSLWTVNVNLKFHGGGNF